MKKILFMILPLIISCQNGKNNVELTAINIEQGINSKKQISFSDIAKKIEFIVLETGNNQTMIGEICDLKESDNRFYINDMQGIKSFDKTGKYLGDVGIEGRGPGEYSGYISDFTVNDNNDDVYLCVNNNIVCYDKFNNLVKDTTSSCSQITFFNKKIIGLTSPKREAKYQNFKVGDIHNLATIYSDKLEYIKEIKGKYKGENSISAFQVLSNNGENVLIKEEFSDTVFIITPDIIMKPRYILNMGNYLFPKELYTFDAIDKWSDFYHTINILDAKTYSVIIIQNGLMGEIRYLLFDKTASHCFTPTGSDGKIGFYIDDIKFTPVYTHKNRIVGYMTATDIASGSNNIINTKLQTIAKHITDESNPILVILTL